MHECLKSRLRKIVDVTKKQKHEKNEHFRINEKGPPSRA